MANLLPLYWWSWKNAILEEQKLTTYKPYRSDDWYSDEAYDLEYNLSNYNEVDHSVMEALSVHLGSGSLFKGYAE
ncbi:MAG: hypothetical protein VX085_02545 [Pseudomonadota bacterium]|nr:hypothetical protein [Pseudomonadota bacterium]